MEIAQDNATERVDNLGNDHGNGRSYVGNVQHHGDQHDNGTVSRRSNNNNVGDVETADPDPDVNGASPSEHEAAIGEEEEEEEAGDKDETTEPMSATQAGLKTMDLEKRSAKMESMFVNLRKSLEFSQNKIDELKAENLVLRRRLGDIETEEERSVYQMKKIEDKVDKVETSNKKRNLVIEGMPEVDGGREDVDKLIWSLFDQMDIDKDLEIDTCYRVRAYSRRRTRPISVSFVRQSDRDLVYSRRTNLGRSRDFKKIWVNEDLGAQSKKACSMIRLITRQAELQGVDHRSGKYAIHIDRVKYDDNNFEELPTKLTPSSVKQVQLDEETIAYQSEYAPFSIFYPSAIVIGDRKFNCAEQAFHYIHAKKMNKHLIAARIYLSRDPREMKRLGEEVGPSDLWESTKFDTIYFCIKKKFERNPELLELLL